MCRRVLFKTGLNATIYPFNLLIVLVIMSDKSPIYSKNGRYEQLNIVTYTSCVSYVSVVCNCVIFIKCKICSIITVFVTT